MKLLGKSTDEQKQKKTVLFVCVENAGRSQIAEGFFNNKYAAKEYRAISAGTRPAGQINPLAVEVRKKSVLTSVIKNQK